MNQQIRRRFPFKKKSIWFRNTEWTLIPFLRFKMIRVLSELGWAMLWRITTIY